MHGEYKFREEPHENTESTYAQAILEYLASDGQGLEELRNGLAACLGVAGSSCCWTLSRSEVGDALSSVDGDIGPSHVE